MSTISQHTSLHHLLLLTIIAITTPSPTKEYTKQYKMPKPPPKLCKNKEGARPARLIYLPDCESLNILNNPTRASALPDNVRNDLHTAFFTPHHNTPLYILYVVVQEQQLLLQIYATRLTGIIAPGNCRRLTYTLERLWRTSEHSKGTQPNASCNVTLIIDLSSTRQIFTSTKQHSTASPKKHQH